MSPHRSPKPRSVPQNPKPKKPRPEPTAEAQPERIQKLLARAGLGSRRAIEGWISAGRVTLNGELAKLGERASLEDEIRVDGKAVGLARPSGARVLLYHKPVGELVTRSDPQGRPTVFSRLPKGRWVAVGRLDINTSGLLLFTDSGDLANRLMHPRYALEREYAVRVHGDIGEDGLRRLREGVVLEDGLAAFERLEPSDVRETPGANRWYRAVLREGRKREVRRLFAAVGAQVSRLIRVRYGPLELPRDLRPGRWRELARDAVHGLFRS